MNKVSISQNPRYSMPASASFKSPAIHLKACQSGASRKGVVALVGGLQKTWQIDLQPHFITCILNMTGLE